MTPLSPRLQPYGTSPDPESSLRNEEDEDVGDMSLPPAQRRHLAELESSFRVDSEPTSLRSGPEGGIPSSNAGLDGDDQAPRVGNRIGDMGPPPVPVGNRRISSSQRIRPNSATKSELMGATEAEGSGFSKASKKAMGSATSVPRNTTSPPVPSSDDENLEHLENLTSSPTVAAQARNISRSVSDLTAVFSPHEERPPSTRLEDAGASIERQPSVASSRGEKNGEPAEGSAPPLSREPSLKGSIRPIPSRSNSVASNSASSSFKRRPKFLRSRQASHHSSVSSLSDFPGDLDDGVSTVTAGDDFGVLSRSTSLGSIASVQIGSRSVSGMSAADRALERLDEEERNSRRGSIEDKEFEAGPSTPKEQEAPREPTDTVIGAKVKNIQVPPTISREYASRQLGSATAPGSPSKRAVAAAGTPAPGQGKNMTLKEQSAIIDRLQKENFDLKIKIYYLNDKLDKLSEEGVKELMQENADMKIKLAEALRERKKLNKRVKELEQEVEEAGKNAKSTGEDEDSAEVWELKETIEKYEIEIEKFREKERHREERMRELKRQANGARNNDEVEMLREFLDSETQRREAVDAENRRLRDELFRARNNSTATSTTHTSTNRSYSERDQSQSRDRSTTDRLRRENEELRREVSAQTSMLTSRNREKERLYQEIEDLKLHIGRQDRQSLYDQHHSRAPSVFSDRLLDRSVSRAGAASVAGTTLTDNEREDFENTNNTLRDRISELRLKNQELQMQLENYYSELETRNAEVEQIEDELVVAQAEVQEMQAERNDALRMREEIEMEFEQLKEEAEEEIQRLEEEVDIRTAEVERLEEEGHIKEEDFKGLQAEMRSVSEVVVRLEDAHEAHQGEVRALEEKIQELERTIQENEQEMNVLEGSLREANEKIERLTVQGESAKGEIAFLREEQDGDKIKIGELEGTIKELEQALAEEKDRVSEAKELLDTERKEREQHGDLQQQEWERMMSAKSEEVSNAKEEIRKLRGKASNREEEAKQWKARLEELEKSLREALGDLSGTRSGLLKSVLNLQTELDSTLEELDYLKNELAEKDRVLKDRENLLESQGLENRKLTDLLDKEKSSHRASKSLLETLQNTQSVASRRITQTQTQYSELEKQRSRDNRTLHQLEQQYQSQLLERNNLLIQLWQKLSALCGTEWASRNNTVNSVAAPANKISVESAIVSALPGAQRNLLAAVKMIEEVIKNFSQRCRGVERDLWKEYQVVENALEARTRRLDRLENLVKGGIGESSGVRTEVAKLRTENRLLKAEINVLKHEAREIDRPSLGRSKTTSTATTTVTEKAKDGREVIQRTQSSDGASEQDLGEKRWILRLRELEKRLKMEREGRVADRSMARKKVEEAREERENVRRELERERDRG